MKTVAGLFESWRLVNDGYAKSLRDLSSLSPYIVFLSISFEIVFDNYQKSVIYYT